MPRPYGGLVGAAYFYHDAGAGRGGVLGWRALRRVKQNLGVDEVVGHGADKGFSGGNKKAAMRAFGDGLADASGKGIDVGDFGGGGKVVEGGDALVFYALWDFWREACRRRSGARRIRKSVGVGKASLF